MPPEAEPINFTLSPTQFYFSLLKRFFFLLKQTKIRQIILLIGSIPNLKARLFEVPAAGVTSSTSIFCCASRGDEEGPFSFPTASNSLGVLAVPVVAPELCLITLLVLPSFNSSAFDDKP